MANGKPGRSPDNPKPYKIAAKLDLESKVLDAYCTQEKVSIVEAVRGGING